MYHIVRSDNREERSLHAENAEGLTRATQEAAMRTEHTGAHHEVVDDNGTVLQIHRPKKTKLERPCYRKLWFYTSALFAALVIFRVAFNKVLF